MAAGHWAPFVYSRRSFSHRHREPEKDLPRSRHFCLLTTKYYLFEPMKSYFVFHLFPLHNLLQPVTNLCACAMLTIIRHFFGFSLLHYSSFNLTNCETILGFHILMDSVDQI